MQKVTKAAEDTTNFCVSQVLKGIVYGDWKRERALLLRNSPWAIGRDIACSYGDMVSSHFRGFPTALEQFDLSLLYAEKMKMFAQIYGLHGVIGFGELGFRCHVFSEGLAPDFAGTLAAEFVFGETVHDSYRDSDKPRGLEGYYSFQRALQSDAFGLIDRELPEEEILEEFAAGFRSELNRIAKGKGLSTQEVTFFLGTWGLSFVRSGAEAA